MYVYILSIFYIPLAKLEDRIMVSSYLSGRSTILKKLKDRMVVTPYEWSQYYSRVVIELY